MKRLVSLVLVLVMLALSVFAMASCGKDDVVDPMTYTYNAALSVFPDNWNPHTYETATDATILDYISVGFYSFDYNETKDGYKLVTEMASAFPVDVTSQYVGQYGIKEGETAKAWQITLRNDLEWDDGTPIKATDFVESAKLLLNPEANNKRADSLYSGDLVVVGAKNYLYSEKTVAEQNFDAKSGTFKYDISDLIVDGNGNYLVPETNQKVWISLEDDLGWLGGKEGATLTNFVNNYGAASFDMTAWEALAALKNSDGRVALTEETLPLLTALISVPAWGEGEGYEPVYLFYDVYYEKTEWEDVAVLATDAEGEDLELTLVLTKPLSGFYLHYSLTSTWLVKTDLYEDCITIENGLYNCTYGTSAATTPSYGPYKLTYFQADKQFKLEKNMNWYGHADHPELYQTTHIQYDWVEESSTRLEMFLAGQLDTYGLQAEDMDTYQASDYCYYATGASTFFVALNPNLSALEASQALEGENINKTILTVKEFRQALSLGLDRLAFALATSPTNSPAFGMFSNNIIYAPETGDSYRSTEQAKDVLIDFWGLADYVGEGKLYETKDEAIASITGYNPTMAKEKLIEAYNKAIAQGLMDADDVVEIKIGLPSASSSFYNNGYDFLVNCYTALAVGTPLEGKITFEKDDTVGDDFAGSLRTNKVDMLFGVGWEGAALNPYSLIGAYTEPDYQYDPAWDTSSDLLEITIDGETYSATVLDWTYALGGEPITIVNVETKEASEFAAGSDVDVETRLAILSALEGAVLSRYDLIPLIDDASATLKGMQINYYTEEYIFGMGHGGLKYYTYNFTDMQWDNFVKEAGGVLNYR